MKNCLGNFVSARVAKRVLLCALIGGYALNAAAEEPQWRAVLDQQLRSDKGCEVDHLVTVREFELAGETVIEARAHCIDGREFDAVRRKPHLPFEIRLCQPSVC